MRKAERLHVLLEKAKKDKRVCVYWKRTVSEIGSVSCSAVRSFSKAM